MPNATERCVWWSSEVIRGHQWSSAVISGHHLPDATERHVGHARAVHASEAHAANRNGVRGERRASCGENATDVRTAIVPDEGGHRRSLGAITGGQASIKAHYR